MYLSYAGVDGISYQSVQHAGENGRYNIAIKPSSFENNYEIKSIEAGVLINDTDKSLFYGHRFGSGKISDTEENKISWSINRKDNIN